MAGKILILICLSIGSVSGQINIDDYYDAATQSPDRNSLGFGSAGAGAAAALASFTVPPPRTPIPNRPLAGNIDVGTYRAQLDAIKPNCEAVTCNFEAGTLCKYFSIGAPAWGKQRRESEQFRMENELEEWQKEFDAVQNPPTTTTEASPFGALGGLLGRRKKRQLPDLGAAAAQLQQLLAMVNLLAVKPQLPDFEAKRKSWVSAVGRLGNEFSGVADVPKTGSSFAGAYLYAREYAVLETELNFTQTETIEFDAYEQSEDVQLKACCDYETECPFVSASKFEGIKGWTSESITCPEGTSKVLFVCSNDGRINSGACGIDNVRNPNSPCIQVFTTSGNVPNVLARIGSAQEVVTPLSEERKQEIVNSLLAGGTSFLGGDGGLNAIGSGASAAGAG